MLKEIYFYCLALDVMILTVTSALCMEGGGGHNYRIVSGLD